MTASVLRWEVPGAVRGRVLDPGRRRQRGPYASLNLGRRTGDDPERVDENRRRACAELGADAERLALNYQTHGATVHRARRRPTRRSPRRRALDRRARHARARARRRLRPDRARRGRTAPRPPLAVAARGPARPAGGSRRERASRRSAAAGPPGSWARRSAPAATRSASEVADAVPRPLRRRRRSRPPARPLDDAPSARSARPASRRRALRPLHRVPPRPVLLAPPRRDAARRPGCRRPLSPDEVRARLRAASARRSGRRDVVAATKYVSLEDMAALAEAGVEVVGENRAQDLEAKHARYGDAFRWHFIGHLQSRKAKTVNRDLRARPLARLRLGGEARSRSRRSSRSTSPARRRSRASPRRSSARSSSRDGRGARGLMTMPPLADDPRRRGRTSAGCASSRREHGLRELSMGTSQDYRVAAEEGATLVRVGSVLYARLAAVDPLDGPRRPLEPHARLLRDRRGGRRDWDEDGYVDQRGARAHLPRAPERPPALAAPPHRRVRRLDRPRTTRPRAAQRSARRRGCAASTPLAVARFASASTSSSRAASTTRSRSRTSSRRASR